MKKSFFIAFLICAANLSDFAQPHKTFAFQKDDTLLKKKYFNISLRKKDSLLALPDRKYTKDYKEIYDDQFKEISSLLQSSRSVTASDANNYLQSVVQKIISSNDELKGTDARIIFSRDWWPNASSFGEGTIDVNAGLMIYLDNEAQLVFVLCHELAHYYLQHMQKAIKKYVETINDEAFQKELKRLSKQQYRVNQQLQDLTKSLAFSSRQHSRNNEAEADMQALKFMRRTGYDCGEIKTCLQLLDKIDDSSIYKSLMTEQVFNFKEYPFKTKWIHKESSIFSQLDENDSPLSIKEKDSLKTHPDCSKRILLLADSIGTIATTGQKFLLSESTFNQLKKNFFMEMTEQCYLTNNLSRNLYYSLLLLQDNENSSMAVYSVVRCLNRIYEKQSNHKLGLTIDTEDKKYPADYNVLLCMLSRLSLDEIAMLNYSFCNQYREQMKGYPGFEDEIKKITALKNQVTN